MSQDVSLPPAAAAYQAEDEIDLRKGVSIALRHRWIIVVTLLFSLITAYVYLQLADEVFVANALVQVEPKNNTAPMMSAEDLLTGFSEKGSMAEIEIIKSRRVMGNVVDTLGLTQLIDPIPPVWWERVLFPFDNSPELELGQLILAPRVADKVFVLTFLGSRQYRIEADEMTPVIAELGRPYVLFDGAARLQVNRMIGGVGQQFSVAQRTRLDAILDLQEKVSIVERGGKNARTGVLELSMQGTDPDRIVAILDAVSAQFQRMNLGRASAEIDQSLVFLRQQLPKIKSDLFASEERLNQYQRANKAVDVDTQAQLALNKQSQLDAQLYEIQVREAEVKRVYKPDHPVYRGLIEQRNLLQGERSRAVAGASRLPSDMQQLVRLKREVAANQEVYTQLQTQLQEMDLMKAGTIGNVRIIDPAMAMPLPVQPKPILVMAAGLLGGLLLAVLLVVLLNALRRGIESAEEIEALGLNVPAVIPLSDEQVKVDRALIKLKKRDGSVLALQSPQDIAIEAIRSFRTSLQFRMMQAQSNVVMISGPAPEVGKSFVTANLAVVLAQAGLRVLLVDADLRRGYLHRVFPQINHKLGLSDFLVGQSDRDQCIGQTDIVGLELMPRGAVKHNPSELLMAPRMGELIEWAKSNYDVVLLDSPPVLAVTDAAILGSHAGVTYLVARHDMVTAREIEATVRRFAQSGIVARDVILNGLTRQIGYSYAYGGYYTYSYKSKKS